MARQKLSPKTILARKREADALHLRMAGVTFDVIAARLGYRGRSGAYAAVKRALARLEPPPEAEWMRLLEGVRLDELRMVVTAQARKGDLAAVDRAVRISESYRKLWGLDGKRGFEADIRPTTIIVKRAVPRPEDPEDEEQEADEESIQSD